MTSNDNSYFESKEFKNILQQFEKSQTSGNPMFMDSDDFSDIAEYYFNHGDFKNAKKAVHVGLDIFPHSTTQQPFLIRILTCMPTLVIPLEGRYTATIDKNSTRMEHTLATAIR